MNYKLVINKLTGEPTGVLKGDFMAIPFDPANTDYAEYLRWLDAGNTPLPSDSVADSVADAQSNNTQEN